MRKRIAGMAVAVALLGGVAMAPQAGAVPTRIVVQAVSEHVSPGSFSSAGPASSAGAVSLGGEISTPQIGAIVKAACKAFISAVKRWGVSAFNALKNAVVAGWTAFRNWVSGIPGWVKATIAAIGQSTAYDWLKSHYNEWKVW